MCTISIISNINYLLSGKFYQYFHKKVFRVTEYRFWYSIIGRSSEYPVNRVLVAIPKKILSISYILICLNHPIRTLFIRLLNHPIRTLFIRLLNHPIRTLFIRLLNHPIRTLFIRLLNHPIRTLFIRCDVLIRCFSSTYFILEHDSFVTVTIATNQINVCFTEMGTFFFTQNIQGNWLNI